MPRRPLPQFKNERELLRFFDDPKVELSLYDLETFGEPVDIEIDKEALERQEYAEYKRRQKLRPVTMRLDSELIHAIKRIAANKSVSYQVLARMWLRESAMEELRRTTIRRQPQTRKHTPGDRKESSKATNLTPKSDRFVNREGK